MSSTYSPSEREYWNRPSDVIAKELPGERIATSDGRLVIITQVEAFRGLVRDAMTKDYDEAQRRKPGSMYVTSMRGFPLLNVTARTDGKMPEVVWLKELFEEGEKISAANLVRSLATSRGKKKLSPKQVLAFAMANLNGKNVTDARSDLKILQNLDKPLTVREISFNKAGGVARNSVGVGSLTQPVNGVESMEQARVIMGAEAERLGITLEDLLNPTTFAANMKKSPLLRKVMRFLEQE